MSKKTRSTMTLKDFHGGSIPSDLQLPSAPGMTVAPYERPANTWGASRVYASDRHRSGGRSLEDRASYFPNPANIGRNYDEDERRPQSSCGRPSAFDAIPEVGRAQLVSNAWVTRREADHGRLGSPDATGSPVRARNNLARIQEASAIDKVSSGRWQPDHARPPSVTGKPGKQCPPQEHHTSSGEEAEDAVHPDDSLPLKADPAVGSYGFSEDQPTADSPSGKPVAAASRGDGGDRPRLKLLPRSKPAQAEQQRPWSDVELEAAGMTKSEPEREAAPGLPRLNLKPRPQGTADKERQSPYGGARPRELVLRERGAEEVALTAEPSSHAVSRGSERKNRDAKHGERQVDKLSLGKQDVVLEGRKVMNRWDQESEAQDGGRRDMESWRRPEEPSTIKHGLAASALELALSFSRASSVTSPQDSFESCFSRLTNTPSPAARYASSRGIREASSAARRSSGSGY